MFRFRRFGMRRIVRRRRIRRVFRIALVGLILWLIATHVFAQGPEGARAVESRLGALGFIAAFVIAISIKIGLIGSAALAQRLRPTLAEAAAARLASHPFTTFLLGLLDLVLLFVCLAVLNRFTLLRLMLLSAALPPLAIGLSGLYSLIGRRELDPEASSFSAVLRGGLIIEAATMIPLAGQFFQCLLIIASLGAGVLTLIAGRRPELPAPTVSPDLPKPE